MVRLKSLTILVRNITHTEALDLCREAGGGVDVDNRAVDAVVTGGDFELRGVGGEECFHYAINTSAEDAIVGAGHADIALESCAAGQETFIGGGDVGVCTEDGRNAAIQVTAHELGFTGRFDVEIDEPHADLGGHGGEDAVGGTPGTVDRFHEELPEQTADTHLSAIAGSDNCPLAPMSFGGKIRGANNVVGGVEDWNNFLAAKNVIAERDRIDACLRELLVNLRRKPRASCGVLGIGDHKIEFVLDDEARHGARDDLPPGAANDVADKEDSHGRIPEN